MFTIYILLGSSTTAVNTELILQSRRAPELHVRLSEEFVPLSEKRRAVPHRDKEGFAGAAHRHH